MASYPIGDIRAIGPFYAGKLRAADIRSTTSLLERTRTAKARKQLSDATDIPLASILKWANLADLTRLKGVAIDYAELMSAAGVDTVKDLARRSASSLVVRMADVNQRKKLVDFLPGEKRVAGWIEQAKTLKPMITH